ncbi:hypothetical protein GCM10009801_56570 [Streptomyces albiaxialis]|uniref:Lipoprotein n=1 Tax=Streptomyces albiaxialis TaxID=329523 RepID=A0ABP5I4A6_9ACTN
MRIRRAIGAVALVLATTALAGCADDPKDKAFGGLGDMDGIPTGAPSGLPSAPSDLPSLDGPGTSSGGLDGGGTGGSTDLPTSPSTPSSAPTYNPSAIGEVNGENCRYSRATSQIKYDVDISNSSTDQSFTYRISVQFKIGSSPDSSVATVPIGTDYETVTVGPGGDRTLTMDQTHSTNQGLRFSCQVMTATKSPS